MKRVKKRSFIRCQYTNKIISPGQKVLLIDYVFDYLAQLGYDVVLSNTKKLELIKYG